MDEILKEYIIDPVENQLQNIISEVDNEPDQTELRFGFNIDDNDYIKHVQIQTDLSYFNLISSGVNTERVVVTEVANKKNTNKLVDSGIQCKSTAFPMGTQTETHEMCTCAQQTEYTGDIMDIKVGEEYWDKDLNNSFFEKFNKKSVAVETENFSKRNIGVQTAKEIQIRIPSETEIELDSLKGTHIAMELKRIVESGIQKEHISTEDLYECKNLIEQKIQIQEKLVKNVKDTFMRHKKTQLEMDMQKTDLENQLQVVKDQNQLSMQKLLHLSEDYKKFQNIMMRKVEELSFESMDSDMVIDQTSRTQLMNTTQQQPFDSEETKQIIDNQDQSKINRKVSMISAHSGSQNSQRMITVHSELEQKNMKSTRSVSEIKQISQQHDQFKKRYSNHQSLTQQALSKDGNTYPANNSSTSTTQLYQQQQQQNSSRGRMNSTNKGHQQDTSINVSNRKRTSFSSSAQHYQQQSHHLNSITSIPDTSQDKYKVNVGDDDSYCSSDFKIPSLKDLEKEEQEKQKRNKKNYKQEVKQVINGNQLSANPKSLNFIPFSQLTRNNIKTTSIHTEAANNLLFEVSRRFIKDKPILNKKKYLPQINKTLSMVYSDLIKFVKNNNALNPLHVVTYEQFIHRFGLRKVAEQKMIQEVQQAMLMANDSNRCKIFIKMLYAQEGVHATSEDKIEEVKFFINSLLLLDESKQAQNYNVDKSFTSTIRVHENLPKIFADILTERQIFENLTKLIKYPPDALKDIQNCDFRRLPPPIYEQADIEHVLDLFLQVYSNRFELLKTQYDCLFKPLQQYDSINTKDFMLLIRCIHDKDEWEFKKEISEFGKKSEGGKMNFYSFVTLCHKMGIFSEQKQREFVEDMKKKNDEDAIKTLQDVQLYLTDIWSEEKQNIKLILFGKNSYTDSHQKLCDIIDAYVQDKEYFEKISEKQVFFAYKLLKKEILLTNMKQFTYKIIGREFTLLNKLVRNMTFLGGGKNLTQQQGQNIQQIQQQQQSQQQQSQQQQQQSQQQQQQLTQPTSQLQQLQQQILRSNSNLNPNNITNPINLSSTSNMNNSVLNN